MPTSTPLDGAYDACRRIHRRYGRTFYLATRLLPRDRQPHVHALYAFARVADEMVDSPGPTGPHDFLAWRVSATEQLRNDHPPHAVAEPVLAATWHTLRRYDLDPHLLEEFLDSMQQDLTVTRYDTWDDLRGYMRGSAAVIGELMAPLLGARGDDALLRAGRLGEAFQLTNFVRDVAEDFGRGRVYLPQSDLRRFGATDDDIAAGVRDGRVNPRMRAVLAHEIARARALYAESEAGVAAVDRWARPCLRAASRLYAQILDEIEAADLDVFSRRAVVPHRDRVRAVLTSWRPLPGEHDPAGSTRRS
ncbi:phytoene/squalene synthase family protein [Luteipulveratus halotolerans]|uniref:Uncharacterized protein n=1 Tax=Luteipulveratus halotolerans TaxID=1631356 RepID=A0A0L6CHH7_9MICO|nr:phytoene/squalene synthase family protein [Luteipulveratus halotolerans]KNX36963.1 hypothetical protein VV01_07060 [Luteipulveratus halotolerans]